jgi:hypothetical protein
MKYGNIAILSVVSIILLYSVNAQLVSHPASEITAGTFGLGDFAFQGNLNLNNDDEVYLRVINTEVGGKDYRLVSTGTGGNLGGAGKFAIYDANSDKGRLVVDKDGNVGIGTISPVYKLHVKGSSGEAALLLQAASGATEISKFQDYNGVDQFNVRGDGQVYMKGKVGIGAVNPSALLEVDGTGTGVEPTVRIKSPNPSNVIVDVINGNGKKVFDVHSTGRVAIESTITAGNEGPLYIDNGNDQRIFAITGKGSVGFEDLLSARSSSKALCYSEVVGGIQDGLWALTDSSGNQCGVAPSSSRYKESINLLKVDKNKVLKLQPVSFKWADREEWDVGLIAEEVEKLIPELVIYEDSRVEGVKYDQLTVYLLEVIKDYQSIIKDQNNRIQGQGYQIQELKKRVKVLEDN